MSVKIRLRRVGATKRPSYRLVVADSRSPRNGRFIETVGHYNPLTEPAEIVLKAERVQHWLKQGAQPTEAVEKLLRKGGLLPSRLEAESQPPSSVPHQETAES